MSKLQQTLLPIKLSESKERLTSLAGLVLVEQDLRERARHAFDR
jgi:hypothetical protein